MHERIARAQVGQHHRADRRHARGGEQRALRAVVERQAVLDDLGVGMVEAAVDQPAGAHAFGRRLAPGDDVEELRALLGAAEGEGRGQEHRRLDRALGERGVVAEGHHLGVGVQGLAVEGGAPVGREHVAVSWLARSLSPLSGCGYQATLSEPRWATWLNSARDRFTPTETIRLFPASMTAGRSRSWTATARSAHPALASLRALTASSVFRIGRTQSPIGAALVRHYGLEPDDPETWLFIEDGRAYSGMEAIIRIGARLGGPGRLLGAMRVLPRSAREWLYRRIARNRYRFGRTDICALPDKELQARLLE